MHLLDATKPWRPESVLVLDPEAAYELFGKDPQDTLSKIETLVNKVCLDWNDKYSREVNTFYLTQLFFFEFQKFYFHLLTQLYLFRMLRWIEFTSPTTFQWLATKKQPKSRPDRQR